MQKLSKIASHNPKLYTDVREIPVYFLFSEKRMFEITMMVSFVILQLTIMTLVTYHFKRQYFGAFIMSLGMYIYTKY